MGKPTGFIEYERKTSAAQTPEERVRHFNEFQAEPQGLFTPGLCSHPDWERFA